MRNLLSRIALVSTLGCGLAAAACTANIHDNTVNIPNATMTFAADADTSNTAPGQAVPVTATATNVYLIDPAATPPPEHVSDAGHFQVYLDDLDSTPLLITAQLMFSVTIPATTPAGHHELKCRLHKHDGTPTSVVESVSVTVTATATVTTGVPDAGAPAVDAAIGG